MKKRFGTIVALLLCLTMSCSLALGGCEKTKDPEGENPGITNPKPEEPETPDPPQGDTFKVTLRSGYTPEKFEYISNEVTKLADGVHLVANKIKVSVGTSVVYTVEVDLEKANIVAGTKNNVASGFDYTKDTPYNMALAWEKATSGNVYAAINADFFGSYCVNAFVKDGVIIKDSHNDQGNYDYKNGASDVPASAPMLFGVKGTTAQVAPIMSVAGDPADPDVKKQLVQAKLTYGLPVGNSVEGLKLDEAPVGSETSYLTSGSYTVKGWAVKVDTSNVPTSLEVLEVKELKSREKLEAGNGVAWIVTGSTTNAVAKYFKELKQGDKLAFSVKSPDGAWDGYETVLGCRQALVINDAVAATITKENTNGAQDKDIPRTAVGVKNGKVVLFAVESLFYYANKMGDKLDKVNDTHGLNLPELAEFAYYYGCSNAANFDGGGSTHLVVHPEGGEAKTVVRSADFGTWGLNETRVVMNAFLITSRVGK